MLPGFLMKICPECAFANEERFPACLWCNALLVDVRSTPAADPDHPEHALRERQAQRHSRQRAQVACWLGSYVGTITFLAGVPGMMFDVGTLAAFAGAALAVGLAMAAGFLGQFQSMFIQGALGMGLVMYFSTWSLLTGFMLLGHIIAPAIFAHWLELIDDAHV